MSWIFVSGRPVSVCTGMGLARHVLEAGSLLGFVSLCVSGQPLSDPYRLMEAAAWANSPGSVSDLLAACVC